MSELNKKLTANTYDWIHAHLFTEKGYTKGVTETIANKKLKQLLINILIIAGYLVIAWVASMIMQTYLNDIHIAITITLNVLLYGGFFVLAYRIYKSYKTFSNETNFEVNYPKENETIMLYRIDPDGITMNYYNKPEWLSSFKWSDVRYAEVLQTQYPPVYRKIKSGNQTKYVKNEGLMKRYLKQDLEKIKEQYPKYPYKETIYPDDEISICFKMANTRDNTLPIPKHWRDDDTAEKFIAHIKEQLGDKFLEKPESVDLIQLLFPNFYDRYFGE